MDLSKGGAGHPGGHTGTTKPTGGFPVMNGDDLMSMIIGIIIGWDSHSDGSGYVIMDELISVLLGVCVSAGLWITWIWPYNH